MNRARIVQIISRAVRQAVRIMFWLVLTIGWTHSHAQGPSEYQVKAAFLYNFAKFIEWPAEAFSQGSQGSHGIGGANSGSDNAPLIVGVMGDDSFGRVIEQTINGKTVGGRQLTVRRLKWGQNLRVCHILYISSYEQRHLTQILESIKGASILTVGEMDQFIQQGGIINLLTEEDRVLFEVNLGVAEEAQLKISSKLLTLAKTIKGGRQGRKN